MKIIVVIVFVILICFCFQRILCTDIYSSSFKTVHDDFYEEEVDEVKNGKGIDFYTYLLEYGKSEVEKSFNDMEKKNNHYYMCLNLDKFREEINEGVLKKLEVKLTIDGKYSLWSYFEGKEKLKKEIKEFTETLKEDIYLKCINFKYKLHVNNSSRIQSYSNDLNAGQGRCGQRKDVHLNSIIIKYVNGSHFKLLLIGRGLGFYFDKVIGCVDGLCHQDHSMFGCSSNAHCHNGYGCVGEHAVQTYGGDGTVKLSLEGIPNFRFEIDETKMTCKYGGGSMYVENEGRVLTITAQPNFVVTYHGWRKYIEECNFDAILVKYVGTDLQVFSNHMKVLEETIYNPNFQLLDEMENDIEFKMILLVWPLVYYFFFGIFVFVTVFNYFNKKFVKLCLYYFKCLKIIFPNDNETKICEAIKYEGRYNNKSEFHGHGCLFIDKEESDGVKKNYIFEGEFKNGKKNGHGKLYHPHSEKIKFIGNFIDDKREGYGVERGINGKIVRVCEWKNDKIIEIKKKTVVFKEIENNLMEKLMEVLNSEYFVRSKLIVGHGTYSTAFKHLDKFKFTKEGLKLFQREVGLLHYIVHPNIVKIIGISSKAPIVGILTELCKRDISSFILNGIKLKYLEKVKILFQTSLGVSYLHDSHIIHRDLKWDNVLINEVRTTVKSWVVKIADFGLARVNDSISSSKTSRVGSIHHMAPEVYAGKKYSSACDVFSFGIMIYELVFFTLDPYDRKNNNDRSSGLVLIHLISGANLRPEIPNKFDKDMKEYKWLVNLFHDCVISNPDKRPTFSKIIRIMKKNCPECDTDILPFSFQN